ncbi:MAG TPA: hypothetical protein VGN01_03390 [Acidobacteriaceae bacterium]
MIARPAPVQETLETRVLNLVSRPVPAPKPVSVARPVPVAKTASCVEIEASLGSKLPPSARRFASWWKTIPTEKGQGPPTQVWMLPRH